MWGYEKSLESLHGLVMTRVWIIEVLLHILGHVEVLNEFPFIFSCVHFLPGTTVSLAVLAIGFQLAAYKSPPITFTESPGNSTEFHHCSQYRYIALNLSTLESLARLSLHSLSA